MFRQKKIPCYVLVFDQVDIVKECLNFLAASADKLDIIVIENPSENTAKISKFVNKLGAQGRIKSYYLFDKNITNNAMVRVIEEQLDYIRHSSYVMMTDGDVTVTDKNWLKEELKILKRNPEVYACGVTLDSSNLPLKTFPHARDWLPPDKAENRDYYEAVTGTHLLLTRGEGLYDYMHWLAENKVKSVDSAMHRYCEQVLGKKWARTKKARAYHLTWDLYADLEHPYTKLRLGKNHVETWQHNKNSGYKLTEYC